MIRFAQVCLAVLCAPAALGWGQAPDAVRFAPQRGAGDPIPTDRRLPRVNFAVVSQSAVESGGPLAVAVTLNRRSPVAVTVPFTVSGTADGSDYAVDASPLVIPAGQASGTITITPVDDAETEADETVVLTMGTPSNSLPGARDEHTLTLVDDDVPEFIVSDDFNQCALGGAWTYVDPVGDGTLLVSGVGTDDARVSLSVPAGVHEAFNGLTVPYIRQAVPDIDFQVEVKFDSGVSGTIQDQGILVLEDTDNWLRFSLYSIGTTMNAFAASTVAGSSAIELNGAVGSTLAPVWLRVTRVGDNWTLAWSPDGVSYANAGSFFHGLAVNDFGLYCGNSGPAHTAAIDYVFDTASPLSSEDGPPADGVGFGLSLAATGGGSVSRSTDQALYYCGESVELTALADPGWTFDRWEGDLTGNVTPSSVAMTSARAVTAIFVPEIIPPVVDFILAGQDAPEQGAPVLVTVGLSAPAVQPVTIPFTASGTAVDGIDYTVSASPLVIGAGQSSADIVFTPIDDVLEDPGETVSLILGVPTNGVLGEMSVHTIAILDDEGPQLVSDDFNQCALAGIWTFHDPGGDGSFFTTGAGSDDAQLVLSVPAGVHNVFNTIDAPYVSQGITDTDFQIDVKFESTFTDSVQDEGVLILEDSLNWLRFDFFTSGSSVFFFAASTVGGVSTSVANINLGPPGTTRVLRVTRIGDFWDISWSSGGGAFVPLTTLSHSLFAQEAGVYVGNNGPAHTAVVDYFFDTSAPKTPEDGAVAGELPRALAVSISGNGSVEQDLDQSTFYCLEQVTLTATADPGWLFDRWEGDLTGNVSSQVVSMDADRNVTAIFVPNNALPSVGFSLAAQDVAEDAGPVAIEVALSETSTEDVSVPFTLSGSASNVDYAVDASPLVIPAGTLSANIVLTPVDDSDDELDETVVITLGAPTNANLLGITAHTATLIDNDLPSVGFALAAQDAPEDGGAVTIVVSLSTALTEPVSVPFTLSGTAAEPADYTIDASPVVIPAGDLSASIILTPVDDSTTESDESVIVTLGDPTNAQLGGSGVHTVTILDNDGPPTVEFTTAAQTVGEGDGNVLVSVQLSQSASQPVTVPFTLSGTASIPGDLTVSPGQFSIAIGATTASVTLSLVDDALEDPGETVILTLGTPTNAELGVELVHTTSILDNDGVAPLSDDFNAENLRQDIWTFIDPFEDATLQLVGTGTTDAQLLLSVPEGVAHEAWTPLNVPRIMQAVPDTDLEVVVKFESNLTTAFQNDGLIFDQGDGLTWVRFDFRYTGTHLQAYASRTLNNSPATQFAVDISPGPWNNPSPLFMRVNRTGDLWTFDYSFDGGSWTAAGSFTQALTLTAVGPFCGNAGSERPAHTTVIDSFSNSAAPITMEDFGSPVDTTTPFIYRVDARALNDTAIQVAWQTDELATGALEYGLTPAYELGFWGTTEPAGFDHTFVVTGLDFDTEYHFRIVSEDASANVAMSTDLAVTTFPDGFTEGPQISFFYGEDVGGQNVQRFGHLGQPQTWVNILGRVIDFNGTVTSLRYQFPGQPERSLSMGPEILWDGPWRLENTGDFNADIDYALFQPGFNDIVFTAEDDQENVTVEICRVDFTPGVSWPRNYTIDWSTVTDIQDVAQVVDGEWQIEDDPFHAGQKVLRNSITGYDRLVALGDPDWDNYEVLVPLTVNSLAPAFNPISNSYAVGFILRWPGHSGPEFQQPTPGFFPFGALFAYRWFPTEERWNHYGTNFSPNRSSFQNPLIPGVPMFMRSRVQTLGDGSRFYQLRVWAEGDPEPSNWFFESLHSPGTGTDGGSLLLLSNYVDVSFGNITVTELP